MVTKRSPKGCLKAASSQPEEMRPLIKWAAISVLLFCCGGLIWHFRGHAANASIQSAGKDAHIEGASAAARPASNRPAVPRLAVSRPQAEVHPAEPSAQSRSPVPAFPAVSTPAAPVDSSIGALVAGLTQLGDTNTALTAESVKAWQTNLMQLVQTGPAAVPALRTFLEGKTDIPFSREAWQATGYSSARIAAIDALRQIGGPDAIAAMQSLMGTTQSPREIALLARDLEEAAPGNYREQALAAARGGLQAAALSRDPQLDVAPLFEVFQHYGDASAIPDLENAMSSWKYYATITLANMPDGAGVASILRMADPASGNGGRVVALEMVAQLAGNNAAAREFLLAQASGNKIAPNLWPYLTGPLTGDEYYPVDSAITQYPQLQSLSDLKTTHLAYGNQNYYTLPGDQSLTADAIQQRLGLVNDLLKVASDPAAVQALQRARDTLAQRSSRLTARPLAASGQ